MSKALETIDSRLESLRKADTKALGAAWQSFFRKPYPGHLPRHLIVGLLAWHLQAQQNGGLSKEEEAYLAGAAGQAPDKSIARFGAQDARHQPGTMFVREHAGVMHQVTKSADGYLWEGREYRSLSAVAFAITGTNWNGPRFFGVTAPCDGSRRGRS